MTTTYISASDGSSMFVFVLRERYLCLLAAHRRLLVARIVCVDVAKRLLCPRLVMSFRYLWGVASSFFSATVYLGFWPRVVRVT